MTADARLLIGRARLWGAATSDRELLARALDAVTPAALGLSPRATLIVQQVRVTRRLSRQGSCDRFGNQVRDELRARTVTARRSRPRGHNDSDLLFDDDAALEAEIVADWLDRPAQTARAWWVPVVGSAPPPERWRRSVFRDAVLLPRVLSRLVEAGHAAPWLARFEPHELALATQRLLDEFGVTLPVDFLPEIAERRFRPVTARVTTGTRPTPNLLRSIAPEALAFVNTDVRALLAVALTIVRRPAIMATPAFANALAEIRGAVAQPTATPSSAGTSAEALRVQSNNSSVEASSARPQNRPTVSSAPPPNTPPEPVLPPKIRNETSDIRRRIAPPVAEDPSPVTVASARLVELSTSVVPVHTQFGGLFFLLNAFVALGLYGDATQPADGLKGLSPFELLVLLGDRWFGTAFRADPLRAMLLRSSGLNPRDRPGRDFAAPIWSVPDDWLRPWRPAEPIRRGKVSSHRAGFVLADDAETLRDPAWRRRRWVGCLARYLEARLRLALDNDDGVAITCHASARFTVDGDRVEVRFVLDRHPIALRLAGLDRDPGWMPMAGYSIGFVFT